MTALPFFRKATDDHTVKLAKTMQLKTKEYAIAALSKSGMVPSCDGRVFRLGSSKLL